MSIVNLKTNPQLQRFIKAVAPSMRKQSAIVSSASTVQARSYWSGGSYSSYWIVSAPTGNDARQLPAQTSPEPFGKFDPALHEHTIPYGKVVVVLGTSSGKPATPVVIATPETLFDYFKLV